MAYTQKRKSPRLLPVMGAVLCSLSLANVAARAQQNPGQTPPQAPAKTPAQAMDAKLAAVTRITVDSFGDDPIAKQLQAMIINALTETKRFIVVEQPGNSADATLKGAAVATTESGSKSGAGPHSAAMAGGPGLPHGESDESQADSSVSANVYASALRVGGPNSASDELYAIQKKGGAGAASGGAKAPEKSGATSDSDDAEIPQKSGAGPAGGGAPQKGGSDSIASSDVVINVSLAVRLVASDGMIVWTATKQSQGTKDKGPVEDAANLIVTQLLSDLAKIPPPAKQ
jgi:hypothetical protein